MPKYYSYEEAVARLRKYCVYRDRCHNEVRSKLIELKVYGDKLEKVMAQLIQDDFLNEERFAKTYVRDKFRINRWGRYKIIQGLKAKYVSDYCIKKGMNEIDEEEYLETLQILLEKKKSQMGPKDRQKVYQFLVRRGFESALVGEAVRKAFLN